MMESIPDSWCSVPLSEVVYINPGVDKSRLNDEDEFPFVPMPAVEAETGRIDTTGRRPFSEVKTGFTSFSSGDVLFAKITPCMENGKMAVVPSLPDGVGFGSTEFHVLRSSDAVDAQLLYYFVSSSSVRHEAQHQMTGAVGQKRVPKRYLETKEFPLPPLNEQRRIVDKIESLFAQLDHGEASLRDVQKLLARYRQSVLKAAVTGQLTADWRAENAERLESGRDLLERILQARRENWQGRGKYKEPVAPDTRDMPELPEGWVWTSVDQILRAGLSNGRSVRDAQEGFPVLRLTALKDGVIDLFERKVGAWDAEKAEPYLVRKGDILVGRGNGSKKLVGRGGLVDVEPDQVAYPDTMIRIPVLLGTINPEWFLQLWNSPFMRSQIEESAKTTAGIYKINQTDIRGFKVPLPAVEEQNEIVERVYEAFDKIRSLERWCATELTRSAALRQSILKDAFAGKLVPQDPADEPASELLARIRAERDAAASKKRTRKKVTA